MELGWLVGGWVGWLVGLLVEFVNPPSGMNGKPLGKLLKHTMKKMRLQQKRTVDMTFLMIQRSTQQLRLVVYPTV